MNIRIKTYLKVATFLALAIVFSSCGKGKNSGAEATESTDTELTAAQGETFPNFEIADMERNNQSTESLIQQHRVCIIDFWASWCGPCRAEMPTLVALNEKYKNRGFGIIGISLDSDHNAWKAAISDMNMSWTQLSELRGWDNTAVKAMEINAIPYTIVVDSQSKILAKDLRGKALADFIDKLLTSHPQTKEKE